MRVQVLLAGMSGSGKTTLARALCRNGMGFVHLQTSKVIAERRMSTSDEQESLFRAGKDLDNNDPSWLVKNAWQVGERVVVDAVRSSVQDLRFTNLVDPSVVRVVRVNVIADKLDRDERLMRRGRGAEPVMAQFQFCDADMVWDSSRQSLGDALAKLGRLVGRGSVDVVIGGQYGSEGKGKLAALLSPGYGVLLRSGGPNAGHWVRHRGGRSYCFHHLPSGSLDNQTAEVFIAAGATVEPVSFMREVDETGVRGRLSVDVNVVPILSYDIATERSVGGIVGSIGSTGSGSGAAAARRIYRQSETLFGEGMRGRFPGFERLFEDIPTQVDIHLRAGHNVLVEGTQGSALSLFHGNYPFVTSRDTNVAGLLSECGIAPPHVRDVWLVVRSLPIRVGGNSGPLDRELSWEEVSKRCGVAPDVLRNRELTSTTGRLRRIGEFDFAQVGRAILLNQPTKLFLTFADYIHPAAAGVTEWGKLPDSVIMFCGNLEDRFGVPVAGVSTGPYQDEVIWR